MKTNIVNVPLERITDNPYQLRTTYDPAATQELASSISTNGLLQSPLGRIVLKTQVLDPEQYGGVLLCLNAEPDAVIQLVFGHRRKRAYEYLNTQHPSDGWKALPVQVCQFTDEEMGISAHVENDKREDLDPIEEATGIRKLMDEFHWTQARAAERLGLSRPSLANKLRLLKLPPSMQDKVHAHALSERQALAVLPFFTLPAAIQEAASQGYGRRRLQDGIQNSESSANLRQHAAWAIRDATASLNDVLFPLDQACVAWDKKANAHAARCVDCPLFIHHKGQPRCGDIKCRDTKQTLYLNFRVHEAAAATLLPANQHPAITQVCTAEETKDNNYHSNWTPFKVGDEEHLAEALRNNCPHLYLAPALREFDVEHYLHPLSYTDVYYVCRHDNGCPCRDDGLDVETAEAEAKATAQQEKTRKRELGRLKGSTINTLAKALENGTAWRAVAEGLRAKVKSVETQALFQAIAKRLIEDLLWKTWQLPQDPEEVGLLVDQWLSRYVDDHVSAHTALEIARRRFAPIQTWYEDLAHEKPDYPELSQRIRILRRILEDMEQDDITGEEGDTLKAALTDILERLTKLSSGNLYFSITPADFKQVSWLFSVPPGDINFKGALEQASLFALRYVLILVEGKEGQKTRTETLRRQIRKLEKQESVTNEAS